MSQPSEGQDHLDYRETDDITEVHASVLREHAEPRAGTMPIPTWLGVVCTASLCWAALYVGMFHGGFSPTVYNEYESAPSAFFPLPDDGTGGGGDVAPPTLAQVGAKVFTGKCAACHMPNGLGSASVPPLGGSEWLIGSEYGPKRTIAILLKGIQGPISVKGQSFNGAMPAWESMKDIEIAGVLTYIRQNFGNTATDEINEAMVKSVRKEYLSHAAAWTSDQLKAIPVDAKVEGAGEAPKAGDAKPAGAPKAGEAKPADAHQGAEAKPAADPNAAKFDLAASVNEGKAIYMQTCMACHQPTGAGLPGAFPPLAKTDYVNGDTRRLVAIALKGIVGEITVNGMKYATGMPQPDQTFPVLKDDKNIANVLNYVRNNFGNKSEAPVTPEFVAKVREEFASRTTQWTESELLNFPPAK